jgi:hypothetical protein
VTAAIGAVKGLFGFGHIDMNILGGKLGNLGLSEKQTRALLKEGIGGAFFSLGPVGKRQLGLARARVHGVAQPGRSLIKNDRHAIIAEAEKCKGHREAYWVSSWPIFQANRY